MSWLCDKPLICYDSNERSDDSLKNEYTGICWGGGVSCSLILRELKNVEAKYFFQTV